jgi:hypothetical protein
MRPFAGGYALPIPRIAALLASWVSPTWAPYIFSGVGLLVGSASAAIFWLPRFRPLLRSDTGRLVLCLLFALTLDGTELLASASNCFWMLGVPVFLFAFRPPVALTRRARNLFFVGSTALAYSTPISVLALPVAATALLRGGCRTRPWHLGLMTGALIGLVIHLSMPARNMAAFSGTAALVAMLVALAQRVILSSTIGYLPTLQDLTASALLPPLIALVAFAVLVSFLLLRGSPDTRRRCLWGLYVLLAALGSSLAGRHFVGDFQQMTGPTVLIGGPRYFYLSSCALAFLVAIAAEELSLLRSKGGVLTNGLRVSEPLVCAMVLAVFTYGLCQNFKVAAIPYTPWNAYADRIVTWKRDRVASSGHSQLAAVVPSVVIPIQPPDMRVILPGNPLATSGFEDAGIQPWVRFGDISAATTSLAHYDGLRSLLLRGSGGVYNDLAFLHRGTTVNVSAYAKTGPAGRGSAMLWVAERPASDSPTALRFPNPWILSDGPRVLDSNGWTKLTVQFTTTSTDRVRIHLVAQSGGIYWDHVELTME